MADDLIGADGAIVNAGTLRAELAVQAQKRADETSRAWFAHRSELAVFDLEAVLEAGKRECR